MTTAFNEKGYSVSGISADIGNKDAVSCMFEEIKREYSKLDVLINNAALRPTASLEDIDEESWMNVLNVNLKGTFYVTQSAAELMKRRKTGSIISISSIAAFKPPQYYTGIHYIVSKGALISFTRGIAKELGPFGIRANSVTCGPIDKNESRMRTDTETGEDSFIKRACSSQEVACTCLFLASDMAPCITGENIILGGY